MLFRKLLRVFCLLLNEGKEESHVKYPAERVWAFESEPETSLEKITPIKTLRLCQTNPRQKLCINFFENAFIFITC